jgi:hypothetical protein
VNGGESPDAEIIAAMATVLQQQQQHRSGAAAVVQLSPTATAATAASTTLEQLEHTAAVQERAEAALKAGHTLCYFNYLQLVYAFFCSGICTAKLAANCPSMSTAVLLGTFKLLWWPWHIDTLAVKTTTVTFYRISCSHLESVTM